MTYSFKRAGAAIAPAGQAGVAQAQEYEGLTPVYTEYNVGNYLRRFTLTNAQHFDRDQISARLVNGVLE